METGVEFLELVSRLQASGTYPGLGTLFKHIQSELKDSIEFIASRSPWWGARQAEKLKSGPSISFRTAALHVESNSNRHDVRHASWINHTFEDSAHPIPALNDHPLFRPTLITNSNRAHILR